MKASVLRRTNMIFVLLLCVVKLHNSEVVAEQIQDCKPNHELSCFKPADYLNSTGPVSFEVHAGKKLLISLVNFTKNTVCQVIKDASPVLKVNGSDAMVLPLLSEDDSGEYTLRCDCNSTVTMIIHVVMKRPTKPMLTLTRADVRSLPPDFNCISEGFPTPQIKWTDLKSRFDGKSFPGTGAHAGSAVSSSKFFDRGAMCCATNAEGQECSQLYDYDLETDAMKEDEVSTVTVSPGQPLLLRCRIKKYKPPFVVWEIGSKRLNYTLMKCSSTVNMEICLKNDRLYQSLMTYLYIESVKMENQGTYTCRSPANKTKSVYVSVQAEGFLTSRLDESIVIWKDPAANASRSCLQADVSYHPVLQRCYWETPDKTQAKCIRDTWVSKHRTVKLCDGLKTGNYKLHLEAAGQKETRNISVCVVEPPKFTLKTNLVENSLTMEVVSRVPANYTWMSCSPSNDSECDGESSWEEIPQTSRQDGDVSCNKTIKSRLHRDLVKGNNLKFCLTNSFGSWCQTQLSIYFPPSHQKSTGASNDDDVRVMALKVGSVLLLLALAVVSIVLMYFVKKKKPKYQSQLQMIQMVGPNDNDYIYVNFKDFEYNQKWEFPRENLELGEELGSGAFGMVVEATAYGISKPGVSQQVAVKMLKEKHQAVEKEALMSELKMLTHIGYHDNIVNLLGACTESGPTYLIFQYCCHGDMLNYLKTNRERYHKCVTDAFNKDRFSSLYHNFQPRKSPSEIISAVDDYMPMYSSATRGQEDIALLNLNSAHTPGFGDPHLDDPSDDLQTLTFDDLLSFAYQVAKGMEFLSSKNCIHRDLAARNVLMTKGRLVKIGDFGLARDIENDTNYVVRGNVRLPVKWMAPESTFQGIYTMKSDVWAYGILLWEIFSLGVTPYPGMKVDHTFYSMIERGFKMECPYYADESVYGIMCKCWALDPTERPSFSKLVSFMCDQLMDREEKLYHNVLDQTPSNYVNTAAVFDTSDSTEQIDEKMSPLIDDSLTKSSEEDREQSSDAAEEKLLTPA